MIRNPLFAAGEDIFFAGCIVDNTLMIDFMPISQEGVVVTRLKALSDGCLRFNNFFTIKCGLHIFRCPKRHTAVLEFS